MSINSDFFIDTKPNLKDMNFASTSDLIDFEQAVYNRERARFANTTTMSAVMAILAAAASNITALFTNSTEIWKKEKSTMPITTAPLPNGEKTTITRIIETMYGKIK